MVVVLLAVMHKLISQDVAGVCVGLGIEMARQHKHHSLHPLHRAILLLPFPASNCTRCMSKGQQQHLPVQDNTVPIHPAAAARHNGSTCVVAAQLQTVVCCGSLSWEEGSKHQPVRSCADRMALWGQQPGKHRRAVSQHTTSMSQISISQNHWGKHTIGSAALNDVSGSAVTCQRKLTAHGWLSMAAV